MSRRSPRTPIPTATGARGAGKPGPAQAGGNRCAGRTLPGRQRSRVWLSQRPDAAAILPARQDRCLAGTIDRIAEGLVLVVGCGARLIAEGHILVYADLARWEAQNRYRRNDASNLGVENRTLAASLQYKRAFFVDWRVCDRWKRPLIARWDFVLDTTARPNPSWPKATPCGAACGTPRPGLSASCRSSIRPPGEASG